MWGTEFEFPHFLRSRSSDGISVGGNQEFKMSAE